LINLAQHKIDDESKIDLTILHHLLQPIEHCYKQLEYQIIALITDDGIGMPTMLDRCHRYYQDCPTELAAIRSFAQRYRSADAVHWYTKDTFLYRFVNKILCTGDIELFHNMRLYIAHLSAQLSELKCEQKQFMKGVNVVYRRLRQSTQELEALKKLIGSVIVTKSFMSASREKRIALFFAGVDQPQSAESQPLLLELTIDLNPRYVIAADIGHLSNFPEEREVLIDMGTEFRVEMLTFDPLNSVWLCQLFAPAEVSSTVRSTTGRSVEIFSTKLDTYTHKEAAVDKRMRYERRHKFDLHSFRSKQSELWRTRQTLPWIVSSSIDLARTWQQKGLRNWQQGDPYKAKIYLENAIVFYEQTAIDQTEFACCLANLSFMLYKTGKYTQAIVFAERSLTICPQLASSEHLILARHHRILGLAYWAAGRIEDALVCHNQALIIDEKARSTARWSMVLTLRNIGLIHRSRADRVQAAEYFIKAWNIFREISASLLQSR
jgi:hypothetical protein